MRQIPKVSVVIPTWNRQGTVVAAIKSCLNQTLPVFEILVCDDGSTDQTYEKVKVFKDSRVKWIPGRHYGQPSVPRNRGIKAAMGEWLAFLDSDDEWHPEKLQKQMKEVYRKNLRAVSSNAFIKGTNKSLLNWGKGYITFKDLLTENPVICSSAVIHSSIIPLVHGFPEGETYRGFEDYCLWLRVATLSGFAFLPKRLVIYRDQPEKSIRDANHSAELIHKLARENFLNWAKTQKKDITYLGDFINETKTYIRKLQLYKLRTKLPL